MGLSGFTEVKMMNLGQSSVGLVKGSFSRDSWKDVDGDACFKCYPRAWRDQPIGWIGPLQPPVYVK